MEYTLNNKFGNFPISQNNIRISLFIARDLQSPLLKSSSSIIGLQLKNQFNINQCGYFNINL